MVVWVLVEDADETEIRGVYARLNAAEEEAAIGIIKEVEKDPADSARYSTLLHAFREKQWKTVCKEWVDMERQPYFRICKRVVIT